MNPYEVLGINIDADEDEIKKAYRQKAMKYHPDRNPGDKASEEKFKEVQTAYDTLTNRSQQPQQGPFPDFFGDFFNNIFNFGQTQREANLDLHYSLNLSFWDAVEGGEKVIKIQRLTTCEGCNGEGALETEECRHCAGRGVITQSQGFVTMRTTCPRCGGSGKQVKVVCTACEGSGLKEQETSVTVKVPEHMPDKMTIHVPSQGNEYKGRLGALLANVKIEPHSVFSRQEDDLLYVLPITYSQAVLGCLLAVPTLGEAVELTIPPATKTGTVMRLKKLGFKNIHTRRQGDLLIRVEVETIPIDAGVEYQNLVEALAKWDSENISPGMKTFREKAK